MNAQAKFCVFLLMMMTVCVSVYAVDEEAGVQRYVLGNGIVQAEFIVRGHALSESYFIVKNGRPRLIVKNAAHDGLGATLFAAETDTGDREHVASPTSLRPQPSPGPAAPVIPINVKRCATNTEPGQTASITFIGTTAEGDTVERTVALAPDDDVFHINVAVTSTRTLSLEYLNDRYFFMIDGAPDFTWTPLMKIHEMDVFPDWSLKAPAAILQKDKRMFALIPDVNELANGNIIQRCNVSLDMDVRTEPGPSMSCGLVPAYPYAHSAFMHIPGERSILEPGTARYAYYLMLKDDVPTDEAYRPVVHFLWQRFGHHNLMEGHAAQLYTFDDWREKTWHEYADRKWMDVVRNGVPCGSLRSMIDDGLFTPWWNNARTAYGLELYGRRHNDSVARERTAKIVNLAFDAPRKDGVFPATFHVEKGIDTSQMSEEQRARLHALRLDKAGEFWELDHMGGYIDSYHLFDMAWTSYWLLRRLEDMTPDDERILPACEALAEFMLKHQRPDGFIPSYFNEDLSIREDTRLNKESAEPGACAVFLIELYKVTGDKKYLRAAIKAMDYIQREIVPERKWFDYETYLSCSPKPYDFYDPITAQHPQNNMGTIQCAKAFLALYDVTGKQKYLDRGTNVLDYLSLTQQVWSHPLLTPNLIGGFTTQNSDAEWSDARQAYAALIYLDYFDRCGNREYLERGIAALRASFPVAPSENYAHTGYVDEPGAVSGIHWGQGSGMASVEMIYKEWGDLCADLKDGWAYGINGCTIDNMTVNDNKINCDITTDLTWDHPARLVIRNATDDAYDIAINGHPVGTFRGSALANGVNVPPEVL